MYVRIVSCGKQFFYLILFCVVFLSSVFQSAEAAFFTFEPNTLDVKKDEAFQVKITIDTEGELPKTSEAIILYDETQIQVMDAVEPALTDKFYPVFLKKITNTKINVGGAIRPTEEAKSGKGTIAILNLKAKTNSKNILSFLCQPGKTTDSNINVRKAGKPTDVIDCTKLNELTINVGTNAPSVTLAPTAGATATPVSSPTGGSSPTQTPSLTATSAPSASPTLRPSPTTVVTVTRTPTTVISPTPSSLPDSGSVGTIIKSVGIGLLLIVASIAVKIFFL